MFFLKALASEVAYYIRPIARKIEAAQEQWINGARNARIVELFESGETVDALAKSYIMTTGEIIEIVDAGEWHPGS